MIFAEFGRLDKDSSFVPGVGDRSVFILDGRNKLETWKEDARDFGAKHKWEAFRIMRGDSFNRAAPVDSKIWWI